MSDFLYGADLVAGAELTIGPENLVSNTIRCTLQLKNAKGVDLKGFYMVSWNVSNTFGGTTYTAPPAVTTTYVADSGSEWHQIDANKKAIALTNADGKLVLDVTIVGTATRYLNCAVGTKVYVGELVYA